MDYLKDIKTMEDLIAHKARVKEEVRNSRQQLENEFEKLFEQGRSKVKKAFLFSSMTGLASLLIGGIFGQRQQKTGLLSLGKGPALPGGNAGTWGRILKILLTVLLVFLKRRRRRK